MSILKKMLNTDIGNDKGVSKDELQQVQFILKVVI